MDRQTTHTHTREGGYRKLGSKAELASCGQAHPCSHPRCHSHTFKLEPKHRIVSALLAAWVAASQFRGCPSVPLSPKCTMVSRSWAPHLWQVRPVWCRCKAVRSVTSNTRTYSLLGVQAVQT